MNDHIHVWMPFFYEIVHVGDGKNVNYILRSVYCHGCKRTEGVADE